MIRTSVTCKTEFLGGKEKKGGTEKKYFKKERPRSSKVDKNFKLTDPRNSINPRQNKLNKSHTGGEGNRF